MTIRRTSSLLAASSFLVLASWQTVFAQNDPLIAPVLAPPAAFSTPASSAIFVRSAQTDYFAAPERPKILAILADGASLRPGSVSLASLPAPLSASPDAAFADIAALFAAAPVTTIGAATPIGEGSVEQSMAQVLARASRETVASIAPQALAVDLGTDALPGVADSAQDAALNGDSHALPSEAPAAPAPLSGAAANDGDLVAALQQVIARASDRLRDNAGIAAFYQTNGYQPIWRKDGRWTPAAQAALERLKLSYDDGLDISAVALPGLEEGDSDALMRQELALSQGVAAYARQASGGRVEPQKISALVTVKPHVASVETALKTASNAGAGAGDALADFNPPHPGYRALREKLAELRKSAPPVAQNKIPAGPTVKLGMRDERVPLVRQRFGISPATDSGADLIVYDVKLAAAVADFQREIGLTPTGVLTPRTVAALSGGEPSRLESDIIASMEFWRWAPRDLGQDRIEVNIPSYGLVLTRKNQVFHRTRVIVGKTTNPTPVFSEEMKYIIVNPYWNVPQSIIRKEMLPRLAADPEYFSRRGYEVTERRGKLIVRQPPGAGNALGRIKFMFPNDHAVYLHDTPSRGAFSAHYRAMSHGCVRVDQPFQLAEAVLGRQNGWSETRVKKMIGGAERTIFLDAPLPIHLQYFTTTVDESGQLKIYDDIYGYTHRMKQALSHAS